MVLWQEIGLAYNTIVSRHTQIFRRRFHAWGENHDHHLCRTRQNSHLMGDIQGVNQVRSDDRYKLPPELGERYRGQHLAAYEKDGKIILEPVEVGE